VRLALWIGLFALGLVGVVVPVLYQQLSAELPSLESEADLRVQLWRPASTGGADSLDPGRRRTEAPDFARLPRDLVAAYVSQTGCPAYFQSGREDGLPWLWRMFSGVWGIEPAGDGRCERLFAVRIAGSLGLGRGPSQWVAANKIHRLLQKDELIAYDLSAVAFESSVVGVDAAAQTLFSKELNGLQLSEIAELMLALPPYELYDELKKCRNASLIRQSRDYLLSTLVTHALVPSDRVGSAQSHPVACTRN
jgi:hypothetical protein